MWLQAKGDFEFPFIIAYLTNCTSSATTIDFGGLSVVGVTGVLSEVVSETCEVLDGFNICITGICCDGECVSDASCPI